VAKYDWYIDFKKKKKNSGRGKIEFICMLVGGRMAMRKDDEK